MKLFNRKKENVVEKFIEEFRKKGQELINTALEGLAHQKRRLVSARENIKEIREWHDFLERYSPEEVIKINLWERDLPALEAEIIEMEKVLRSGSVPEDYSFSNEKVNLKLAELHMVLYK